MVSQVNLLTQDDFPLITEVAEDILIEFPSTPSIVNSMTPELYKLLRVRIGLTENDQSKDVEIVSAWVASITCLEKYLDRYLVNGTYTETFTHVYSDTLSLKAYPMKAVASVDVLTGSSRPTYHVDMNNGVMYFDGMMTSHRMQVSYDATPMDDAILYMACLLMFDSVFKTLTVSSIGSQGGISSVSVPDVGTIRFTSEGSSSSASGTNGFIPANILGILELYRRKSC